MMANATRFLPCIIILCLLSACGAETQSGQQQGYKETKSMVVDILKTEEAQKAIEESMKEKNGDQVKIKQMLASSEGQQIQTAVKDVLTDPNYPMVLKEMMTDPKFAGEFAKAVQKENEKIHKELMKDPEYQTLLLDVMKSGDFEDIIVDVLKGKEYREQSMTIFKEALENPLFKSELIELMKKAMEEESKKQEKKKSGEGGGEGGGS